MVAERIARGRVANESGYRLPINRNWTSWPW